MLVNICMKFHEGILNVFLITERTRPYRKIYYFQTTISQNLLFSISKGHNSKNTQSRVTVLALCTSSHVALHLCKVSWKYLKRFWSCRVDTILWQTDGQTVDQGKNNTSPNPAGGDIIKQQWNHIASIWATSLTQNNCAPCEDSDQPGHPPSLIRVFAVRSMGS